MFEAAIPIAFSGGIGHIQSKTGHSTVVGLADGDDVEGGDRPLESLERELAGRLHLDFVLDLRVEALRDQDLAGVASSASRDARFVTAPIAA